MRDRLRAIGAPIAVNVLVLALALGLSMIVIEISGASSVEAAKAMWDGAWGQRAAVGGTLSKTIPLVLVALGWVVAYGARRVNIGFEGQILIGGVFAAWVGLKVTGLPIALHLPLAVAAGVVGGGLWAGVSAWLWAKRGVNEIISTLLLNFVAIEIVSWLVRGPFQEPTGTFPRSGAMAQTARWPKLMERTALGWDLLLALVVVGVVALLVARTTFGFRLRFTGANEEAARHGGVNTRIVSVAALLISGALAGLAGSSLILGGESPSMADNFSANFGFTGIVVALLARNNPLGAIPAGLLFATLRQGGGLAEARVGVSSSVVLITQALVIVFVAGAAFILDRRRSVRVDAPGGPSVPLPTEHPTPQATVA